MEALALILVIYHDHPGLPLQSICRPSVSLWMPSPGDQPQTLDQGLISEYRLPHKYQQNNETFIQVLHGFRPQVVMDQLPKCAVREESVLNREYQS